MTSGEHVPTALKQGERRRWRIVSVAMLVLIYMGWSLIQAQITKNEADSTQATQNRLIQCITTYVSLNSQRAAILGPYTSQESTAQDVVNGLTAGDPRRPAAVAALHEAQAILAQEQAMYPPPKFTCTVKPSRTPTLLPSPVTSGGVSLPSVVTSTAHTTATRTATATATVPGPTTTRTATRMVPLPVHGRVRTVTRTVTRTVSPPSCLTHPIPPCVLDVKTH